MVKYTAYASLAMVAGVFFNILNLLLGGNLPPFGCISVIIREEERYLLLERPNGLLSFPSGFIRWREHPVHAARREIREETGLQIEILDMIGCFFEGGRGMQRMSTLTLFYSGVVSGGTLRASVEGRPRWIDAAELPGKIDPRSLHLLESYHEYYEQHHRERA